MEGVVFASANVSPGVLTTCNKCPYLFSEYAEDLAQKILEGGTKRGKGLQSFKLITFPESTEKVLQLARRKVLHCISDC